MHRRVLEARPVCRWWRRWWDLGRPSLSDQQPGWEVEPYNICALPALWHFQAGDSSHERAVRMELGIQKLWFKSYSGTGGEVCSQAALSVAWGIHPPAVRSLPALPIHSQPALPDSNMLPQWFLTSFSVFRAKLPGNGSCPLITTVIRGWAQVQLSRALPLQLPVSYFRPWADSLCG